MTEEEKSDFIIMLLIENLSYNDENFSNHLLKHYNIAKINSRYRELLDKFLNDYALNKSEKSE